MPPDLIVRVSELETAVAYLIDPSAFMAPVDGTFRHFNGQTGRAGIFEALLERFDFEAIVETGTYLGSTTRYLAQASSLPVYSCEVSPLFFAIANRELADEPNVNLFLNDSRAFLNDLVSRELHHKRSFIYLDAHWHSDLPLAEEVDTIARSWNDFVLMIDDFAVPRDEGYGFDDYGDGKRFTLADFGPVFERNSLVAFFPATPSAEETGYRRGCVVVARRGETSEALCTLGLLTQAVD